VAQTQPGWYPDPWQQPYQPVVVRWWDGTQWTGHVQPAGGAVATAYPAAAPTTPDGAELASWGRRLAAYLLDALILMPVFLVVSIPFWSHLMDPIRDYWHDSMRATDSGAQPPSAMSLQRDLLPTMMLIALVNYAISFVYQTGFLMWKQATPGKLLLGLRVRRREIPGPMPFGTVVLRWLTQFGPAVLGVVPFVAWAVSVYQLLDGLWPLWDSKRQALHDKAARTNVIRVHPS